MTFKPLQPTPLQFSIYAAAWLIILLCLFRLDGKRKKKKQIRELIPLYLRAYGPMTAYEVRLHLNEAKVFITQQRAVKILYEMIRDGMIAAKHEVREFSYVVVFDVDRS